MHWLYVGQSPCSWGMAQRMSILQPLVDFERWDWFLRPKSALKAVKPARAVIFKIAIFEVYSNFIRRIHGFALALHKHLHGVNTAQMQNGAAHRRFDQNRHIASGFNLYHHFMNVNA